MQKRRIGQTDIEVSVLGLGTVKWGRNQGVKYPAPFQLPTDREIKDLLAVAREQEINLLDTAPAYGLAEQRLGELLQGQRHDGLYCVCTLVWPRFPVFVIRHPF